MRLSSTDCSIVFERADDLWLGSDDSMVSEWSKSALTKSGSPARKVTITLSGLDLPCKPAFDQRGDLWAGNSSGGSVVEFTKEELAKSGSPAPNVTLSSQAIDGPGDVAVDPSGELWVPDAEATTVIGFTKSQVSKSGFPPPAFNIAGLAKGLNWPWAVATEE
jgi:ligand-binding sensor domain-containing protein